MKPVRYENQRPVRLQDRHTALPVYLGVDWQMAIDLIPFGGYSPDLDTVF